MYGKYIVSGSAQAGNNKDMFLSPQMRTLIEETESDIIAVEETRRIPITELLEDVGVECGSDLTNRHNTSHE